ncbi:hypothetical protein DZJ_17650 [Dickeya ananatis]
MNPKKNKVTKNANKKGAEPTHGKKPEKNAKSTPAKTVASHDKNAKSHNDKKSAEKKVGGGRSAFPSYKIAA